MLTRLCPNCGGEYRTFASYVKRGGSKTCGRQCPKRAVPHRLSRTIHSVKRWSDSVPMTKVPFPVKPKRWGTKVGQALDRTFKRTTTPDLSFRQR